MTDSSMVLIVDDSATGRHILKALLVTQGYQLAFASNGPEALAKAAELIPDLILLDVLMPGMDGFEVCRRLRADPLLAGVPIIMVTAMDDRDYRLRSIEAGADDFVSKPFDQVELRARVRTITRLNRFRRLLSERAKFEWVVEQAEDGYLNIGSDDKLLYANPRALFYLGLPVDLTILPGETFLSLARKHYQCEPHDAWTSWPKPSPFAVNSPRYLVRAESANAKAFWLRVDIRDIPDGPDVGYMVRLHDVSAEMNLQKDMWKFHSVIFHKLRTPLVIMSSSLDLLAAYAPRLSTEEVTDISKSALKGLRRLQSDVEDILQYLSAPNIVQAGEGGFLLGDLPAVVNETSTNLGLQAVLLSMPDALKNVQIILPRRAVEMIFWEVLENSKKFHPTQDPRVEIIVLRPTPREINLWIADDGVTLSPEQLANAWTPYYQGEKNLSFEISGMGLGLPMVATLIWEGGGTSRIANREDRPGVIVEIVLPIVSEEQDS